MRSAHIRYAFAALDNLIDRHYLMSMTKENNMTYRWGEYILVITDNESGKVVYTKRYENMSGTAMMDEQKFFRRDYPMPKYRIEW